MYMILNVFTTYLYMTFAAMLSSALHNRYGARLTCALSAIVSSFGLIASVFSTSIYYLIVSYGIICGEFLPHFLLNLITFYAYACIIFRLPNHSLLLFRFLVRDSYVKEIIYLFLSALGYVAFLLGFGFIYNNCADRVMTTLTMTQ